MSSKLNIYLSNFQFYSIFFNIANTILFDHIFRKSPTRRKHIEELRTKTKITFEKKKLLKGAVAFIIPLIPENPAKFPQRVANERTYTRREEKSRTQSLARVYIHIHTYSRVTAENILTSEGVGPPPV